MFNFFGNQWYYDCNRNNTITSGVDVIDTKVYVNNVFLNSILQNPFFKAGFGENVLKKLIIETRVHIPCVTH